MKTVREEIGPRVPHRLRGSHVAEVIQGHRKVATGKLHSVACVPLLPPPTVPTTAAHSAPAIMSVMCKQP